MLHDGTSAAMSAMGSSSIIALGFPACAGFMAWMDDVNAYSQAINPPDAGNSSEIIELELGADIAADLPSCSIYVM